MKNISLPFRIIIVLSIIGLIAAIIEFTYYNTYIEKKEVSYYPAHLDCGY